MRTIQFNYEIFISNKQSYYNLLLIHIYWNRWWWNYYTVWIYFVWIFCFYFCLTHFFCSQARFCSLSLCSNPYRKQITITRFNLNGCLFCLNNVFIESLLNFSLWLSWHSRLPLSFSISVSPYAKSFHIFQCFVGDINSHLWSN